MATTESNTLTTSTSIDVLVTHFLNRVLGRKEETRTRPRRSDLPWESWDLDQDFFRALSRWTLKHPETSLDRVVDNISNGLERFEDLLSLIPDSPFPARGLVTALGYLSKLAVTISRAKRDVQEFSKGFIHWVGLVKSAFESKEDGHFTRLVWKNLKDMRDLVNEICSWAVRRLEDKRWSRIGHGLTIQSEIQEFIERIVSARALFQDLSVISLAKGLDVIIQSLQNSSHRQQVIVTEIKKIQETQEKQLGAILHNLESQKLVAERERFLAEALARHTVADPTYDGQGKRPCDPDTRIEILAEIDTWINDIASGSKNFLWLTGDPGCGKSAITASVSKACKRRNILWAQFFINRNNTETTNPNFYFPSIASQLARRSPAVAEALKSALQKDRTLTDGISADQAAKLFINSIRCASLPNPKQPVVVVIDGLDETERKRLKDTAYIFSTLFTALASYGNVKFFISSRTENDIRNSFVLSSHDKHVKRIHLDTAHPSSIQDVSHYIKRNLSELVKEHDLNWTIWPGDNGSRALGERASGLFIWGVTAVKFIQERLEFDGTESLSDVLDMLTADVLHDINALYTLILKVTYGAQPSDWDLERFRRIVGAIVFLQEPLSLDELAALLDLRKTPSSDRVDIPHFVRRFRTILVTGTDLIDGSTVPRIHKSVFEFITSDGADAQFRVDPEDAHLELGMQCLAQLSFAHTSVAEDVLPTMFHYASRFWSSHLLHWQARGFDATVVCADLRHSPSSPLPSLFTQMVPVRLPIEVSNISAESKIQTTIGGYALHWDSLSGANVTNHTEDATHLVFSPDAEHIMTRFKDGSVRIWDSASRWLRAVIEHSSPIDAVAFSPDGKSVVSGSQDGSLCLWDSSTGALIGQPFRGHKGRINCAVFSRDGELIVSGSHDQTCILWNVQNRQVVGKPWVGHDGVVTSIAFSANGRRVCSGDNKGNCVLWDVSTGQKMTSWEYHGEPFSISFSPQNDEVIVIGGWNEVEVRSKNQRWSIPDSEFIQCMSFSSDGKQLIFAKLNTICVAQISNDQNTTRITKKGKYDGGYRAASVSPDLRYIAWVDKTIHVCALQHSDTSLNLIPIKGSLPTTTQTKDGNNDLMDLLSDMQEVRRNRNIVTTNRRLDQIKWYNSSIKPGIDDTGSVSRLLMVTDNAIIAAYTDGSLATVWNCRATGQ